MRKINPEEIIDLLKLEPLAGEGGMFRQAYRSDDVLLIGQLPARYQTHKPAGTAIYYLLTADPDSFSALHRLPTDEVYHFYLGDPVELTLLVPGGNYRRVILGQDLLDGQQVQFAAPRGVWQGSRLCKGGEFALLGTTMAPGFTDGDFELANRDNLLAEFPEQTEMIRRLTR